MAQSALQRVRKRGEESLAAAIASSTAVPLDGYVAETELWMLLIVRIITRGAHEPEEEEEEGEGESTSIIKAKNASRDAPERMRRILCNYVLGDFANRFVKLNSRIAVFLTSSVQVTPRFNMAQRRVVQRWTASQKQTPYCEQLFSTSLLTCSTHKLTIGETELRLLDERNR